MDEKKRKRLQKAGWTSGSAADFLGLTTQESAIVQLKIMLARLARETRLKKKLTQAQLGKELGTNQARVAKIEAADQSVSLDQMFKTVVHLGLSLEMLFKPSVLKMNSNPVLIR